MRGRGWKAGERARAEELHAQGKTYAEIGVELDRSKKSVHQLFRRIRDGMSTGCRQINPWSKEEIAQLERLRAEGRAVKAIGQILGRPQGQIYSKLQALRQAKYAVPVRAAPSLYIPPDTEREWRARQQLSHTNLTAAFCGDPLPGRSALERRA